jgi:hypothetical protein
MAIFYPFSRSPEADSGGLEKRDSEADSARSIVVFGELWRQDVAGGRGPATEKLHGSL